VIRACQFPSRKPLGKQCAAHVENFVAADWSAVLTLAGLRSPLRICIVGANDGKFGDPGFPLIESQLANEADVLLFEPQPFLIPILAGNYAFHPTHHIVNAALGPGSELVLDAVRQEA